MTEVHQIVESVMEKILNEKCKTENQQGPFWVTKLTPAHRVQHSYVILSIQFVRIRTEAGWLLCPPNSHESLWKLNTEFHVSNNFKFSHFQPKCNNDQFTAISSFVCTVLHVLHIVNCYRKRSCLFSASFWKSTPTAARLEFPFF